MRLNAKKYRELMEQKDLTVQDISFKTGLLPKNVEWIMNNGLASEDALERLAEAAGVTVKSIYLSDISSFIENTIEFEKDSERATVTFSQGRYKNRIRELAKEYPDKCQIVAMNKDGSIYAHIPVAWIRINPSKELTEEERKRLSEHARNILNNRSTKRENV